MPNAPTSRPLSPALLPGVGHLALLAATFFALLAWTWGSWPDVLVDFGRELYVPWQLAQGKRLYLDLAWFNGPLSPSWNALMFRLFGVSLRTLVWVNAGLFALLLTLLHSLLRSFGSRASATLACLLVMAVSGFGQLLGIGNYNYICPYSHEATHGLLLGLAALVAVERWSRQGRPRRLATAAGLVGLSFLTKPEMFVAALAATAVAVGLRLWSERASGRRILSTLAVFALGLALPVLLAGALLSLAVPFATAWRGILGGWPALFATDVAALPFYRAGAGLDAPVAHAFEILRWAAGTATLVSPALFLAWATRRPRPVRWMAGLALAITAAMAALLFSRIAWTRAALPWPLFCLGALAVAVRRLREAAPEREREIAAATFAAFALALLGKMLLNARTSHYGFVLAMPALALLVVVLYDGIPRWIERQGGTAAVARAGLAPLLVAFALAHLSVTARHLAAKRIPVGDGPDAFRADPRGLAVNATLTWLAGHTAPGSRPPTVLVVPEGVLINYLARSENPTPYVNFMPPEILLFGEPRIVETLASHPPDVVVVTHKPTHEYGLPWFGRDYAAELAGWLERNYHPVELFGDSPLHPGSRFGIAILARNGGGR